MDNEGMEMRKIIIVGLAISVVLIAILVVIAYFSSQVPQVPKGAKEWFSISGRGTWNGAIGTKYATWAVTLGAGGGYGSVDGGDFEFLIPGKFIHFWGTISITSYTIDGDTITCQGYISRFDLLTRTNVDDTTKLGDVDWTGHAVTIVGIEKKEGDGTITFDIEGVGTVYLTGQVLPRLTTQAGPFLVHIMSFVVVGLILIGLGVIVKYARKEPLIAAFMKCAARRKIAFILSVIGGLLMLFGASVMYLFTWIEISWGAIAWGAPYLWFAPYIYYVYWSAHMAFTPLTALCYTILGFACAIGVIDCAVMLCVKPQRHRVWGLIILVCSVLSFLGAFGGFLIGMMLGITGGITGIT